MGKGTNLKEKKERGDCRSTGQKCGPINALMEEGGSYNMDIILTDLTVEVVDLGSIVFPSLLKDVFRQVKQGTCC